MTSRTSRRTVITGMGAAAVGAFMPLAAARPANATAASSSRRSAATVLYNGVIFTGERNHPPAQALAIGRDGRILAVGTNTAIRRYLGRDTEAVDLCGGFVMPGLHDGHQHPIAAGAGLHRVSFADAALTIPQMQAILTAALNASASKEPDGWLEVSAWNAAGVLPTGTVVTKHDLDVLSTRRPIYIGSSDFHNAWVNSRALALAGVTRDTPDPAGGTIVRDATGEPTGLLKDAATGLVSAAIPAPSFADTVAATREAFGMLVAAGVTTVMDAAAGEETALVFAAMHNSGDLKVRTHLAYLIDPDRAKDPRATLAELTAFRRRHQGIDRLNTGIAKVFMDGVVEYPAQTAALLEPYLVNQGTDTDPHWVPGTNLGNLYFDQATITALALTLDHAGWQLHAHTIGDRAVRTTVNAYEAAYQRHGDRGNRHTLTHVELIHPADIRRVARSRVLCCMQLQWAETDFYTTDALLPYVGAERQGRIYPVRTMEAAGVRLTGGTDWPIDRFAPWRPVEQAITRTGDGPALHPEEGLSRFSALSMYTLGGAYQLHQDHRTGTLTPGKEADLVHVDRNLLRVNPREIAETQTHWTMINGEVVYEASTSASNSASVAAGAALAATGARTDQTRSHTTCGHDHIQVHRQP